MHWVFDNNISFEKRALRLFKEQSQKCLPYHQYLKLLKIDIESISSLAEIPFLPIQFFKTHSIITNGKKPAISFISSGTTGMQHSQHLVADLSIYEYSFRTAFELFYGDIEKYRFLALLPSYLEREGSSLIYMCEDLIKRGKHPQSGFYLNNLGELSEILKEDFYISPILFAIPASVLILAYFKVKPVIALSFGVLFAIIVSVIFQSNILEQIDISTLKAIFSSVFTFTEIPMEVIDNTKNTKLLEGINDLYTRGGMESMLWVILLTMCAMVFGGAMEAIGALNKITNELLKLADSAFGLVTSTVASCLGVNLFASDQYLAIIIPGKMFKNAFKENDLAPENLSRTLEDSGTVTSALIPWNTCGAYHLSLIHI